MMLRITRSATAIELAQTDAVVVVAVDGEMLRICVCVCECLFVHLWKMCLFFPNELERNVSVHSTQRLGHKRW